MFNIRKAICRVLRKGSFLYKIFDCKRYEVSPPIPPIPPEPPEPPVPTKPPYIGTSVYQLIKYPIADVYDFLDKIVEAGGNSTEVFFVFTWDDGWRWQPYELVSWMPDEGSSYGDYKFPVYDLTKFDEQVWHKWGQIFEACKERNLTLFVRIMDHCSLKDGFAKRHNCFRSNVQRLVDHTLTGGLYGEPIRKYYSALNTRLVKELDEAGVDYKIVPWNEFDVLLDGWTEEEGNAVAIENMDWWCRDLSAWGVNGDDIILSVSRSYEEIADFGYRMEIHGVNSTRTLRSVAIDLGDNIFPNGDGIDPYAMGEAGDSPSKREPSVDQGEAMGFFLSVGVWGYCYFNRRVENTEPSDIRRANCDVLKAIVDGMEGE